jgi:hypothetical protein
MGLHLFCLLKKILPLKRARRETSKFEEKFPIPQRSTPVHSSRDVISAVIQPMVLLSVLRSVGRRRHLMRSTNEVDK